MRLVLFALYFALAVAASAKMQYIARMNPGVDPSVVEPFGFMVADTIADSPYVLLKTPPDWTYAQADVARDLLAASGFVAWVEDDYACAIPEHGGAGKGSTIGSVSGPDTFKIMNAAALTMVNWPGADFGQRSGTTIAIIDTGLSPNVPSLWTGVVATLNTVEPGQPAYDIPHDTDSSKNGVVDEGLSHGTMIAGIIASMAPRSPLIIVRALDSDGVGDAWNIIKGMIFALDHGAKVFNLSWGSADDVPAIYDVMVWAQSTNAVYVASSGNLGQQLAWNPAQGPHCISVTGIDSASVKTSWANWDGSIDACAPSMDLFSCWWDGTVGVWSGTSFAAPLVTSAVALAFQYNPTCPAAMMIETVTTTGTNVDGLPGNEAFAGQIGTRLNIQALLLATALHSTISGIVTFEFLAGPIPSSIPMEVNWDGIDLGEMQVPLDATGAFSLDLPAGSITVESKTTHWLERYQGFDTSDGSIDEVVFDLYNGDANNDNVVDLKDLNMLFIEFGEPTPMADLDEDGIVSLGDINIVFMNFGLEGA
jgi:hypothetical protein